VVLRTQLEQWQVQDTSINTGLHKPGLNAQPLPNLATVMIERIHSASVYFYQWMYIGQSTYMYELNLTDSNCVTFKQVQPDISRATMQP
jgi:hypothetical protein